MDTRLLWELLLDDKKEEGAYAYTTHPFFPAFGCKVKRNDNSFEKRTDWYPRELMRPMKERKRTEPLNFED